MAALNKLPYETLGQILSSLSNADLARTSLVSRRLCAVSEPLLYAAPCLTDVHSGAHRPSLDRFLKTLIASPRQSLGSHVRFLSVTWDHGHTLDSGPFASTGPFLNSHRPNCYHGARCVTLLQLVPSVQVLRISPPPDSTRCGLSYFSSRVEQLDHAPCSGPVGPTLSLQSLREFSCSFQENGGGLSVLAVLALMKLPCINSIDTHIVDLPRYDAECTIDDAAQFSTVTKLRLSWVNMSVSLLSVLVNAPAALTHFSYLAVGYTQFHMVDFMDTVSPLRPTLQHLHLDLVRVSVTFTSSTEDRLRSSLRGWPVLETLSCSLVELLGNGFTQEVLCLADVLPHNLRGLQILQDRYWMYRPVVDTVVELLLRKQEAVPALERVSVRTWSGGDAQAYAVLGVACGKAGVRLVEDDSFGW